MAHFTRKFVTNATCPPGRPKICFTDQSTKGLVLEVRASGGKTFYLRQTDDHGRQKLHKLARAEDITVTDARQLADQLRRQLIMGEDPKQAKADKKNVPTFSEFAAKQYVPHAQTYKKSVETDVSILNNHLLPVLGKKRLDEITHEDVKRVIEKRIEKGDAPASANRTLILARYMFNQALKWKVPGVSENPASDVEMLHVNNQIERYLNDEETATLYAEVTKSRNKTLKSIIAALILTGARKSEVLNAEWSEIDFERRSWRIPDSKSGYPRHIPLNDQMITLLKTLEARNTRGSKYVFANPKSGKPFVTFYHAWDKARRAAGLPNLRVHDLRHSFASLLVNSGRSIYEVQRLLGHTQIKTTMRYAHLSNETLIEASNTTSRLSGILKIEPP